MIQARSGNISEEMKAAASHDNVPVELIYDGLRKGTIVLPKNNNRKYSGVRAIGSGLHTKVNVNIGSSPDRSNMGEELEKLRIAERYGADSIMDLSIGAASNVIRRELLKNCNVVFGTVPLYQVCFNLSKERRDFTDLKPDDFLKVIRQQAEEGVDFMTIHAGLTKKAIELLFKEKRLLNIVSRGGSFLTSWMAHNKKENPMLEHFDEILEICKQHDVTISLGDGLRPGATADATDHAQIMELIELGALVDRCRDKGVQVMVEGPGHVPLNQIEANMRLQKKLCHEAPFYVLGPLTIDFAPGYDHITSAIGGALAAMHGADFLCYVTPAEHLRLPDLDDVRQGVIASKIAAYSADLAKGFKDIKQRTDDMSIARRKLDWEKQAELSVDPDIVMEKRAEVKLNDEETCSMCGEFCAIKKINAIK